MLRRWRLLQQFTDKNSTDEDRENCRKYLAANISALFDDWLWTYDPRNVDQGQSALQPFDLWPKQREYLAWLEDMEAGRKEALVEKSRDAGATSLSAGFALHRWLFRPGYKTTFGSRVEDLVDKFGNPDTIFEKIRGMMASLPVFLLPDGYKRHLHSHHMRIINPATGSVIAGQGGSKMGRGGRNSIYFIDEAAHVESADQVEMAVVANSDVRIWVSSVNGMGNLFARKVHSGRYPVFVFDWRDDPRKDKAWEQQRRAEIEDHVWAQEYARDYGASVEDVCIPGAWVQSARSLYDAGLVEAHPEGTGYGGLDVGAGGSGKSVLIVRRGSVVMPPKHWSTPDTISMAYDALAEAKRLGAKHLAYDNIGVGTGPASAFMHSDESERLPTHGVNVGKPPTRTLWPDKLRANQKFDNLKAELHWILRERFKKAHERWLWEMDEDGGVDHPLGDVIAIPPHSQLEAEISYPKRRFTIPGKIAIETKQQMAMRGIKSPDYLEALVLTCFEPGTGTAEFHIN